MDDLDEIYRPVFADAVVEDMWSGATGTPAQLQSRFAAVTFSRTAASA